MKDAEIIVLGAGIAGLTAAFHLQKSGKKVLVLEGGPRCGGVIETGFHDGFTLEYGPNTVLPTPEIWDLVQKSGLAKEVQLADAKSKRFVVFNNRFYQLPLSPLALLTSSLLSVGGKLALLSEPFKKSGLSSDEETVGEFARRRLGTEATERLLAPFVAGVWAGDIEQLSAAAAFPKLISWEKTQGSLWRGMRASKQKNPDIPKGLLSFRRGLEELPRALAGALGENLHLNEAAQELNRSANHWTVKTARSAYEAAQVIVALPAQAAAKLVRPLSSPTADALQKIPSVDVTMLHLALPRAQVDHPLDGFGFLCAPMEKAPILGCLFSSSIFPERAPAGQVLLTVFMRGEAQAEALSYLQRKLGLRSAPKILSTRKISGAIPQYNRGHLKLMQLIHSFEISQKTVKLVGSWKGGISVGDVVRNAKECAESCL